MKVTISIRIEPSDAERADAVAKAMGEAAGTEMGRGDAARAALIAGLDILEAKFGLTTKGTTRASGKTSKK